MNAPGTVRRVEDPKGRLDLLILRLAEHSTELLERRIAQNTGHRISLWPHLEPIVQGEIKRRKIPKRPLTLLEAMDIVTKAPKRRRLKCTD